MFTYSTLKTELSEQSSDNPGNVTKLWEKVTLFTRFRIVQGDSYREEFY